MSTLQVFDPPMCCSTGVCGPTVDRAIVQFAADLEWLKTQGVRVERYNLAQQSAAFVAHPDVKATLAAESVGCLPLICVDGSIVSKGSYPTRRQLAAWAGIKLAKSLPVAQSCTPGITGCCGN